MAIWLPTGIAARLTATEAAAFAPAHGEAVWKGTVDLKGNPNSDTVTRLPIDQIVGALKPGLYIATAKWGPVRRMIRTRCPPNISPSPDLGLSAYRGPGSLLASVRSLSSAAAAPGIDIALVGTNNRELARVRSDGNGLARFDGSYTTRRRRRAPWLHPCLWSCRRIHVADA